MGIGVGHHLGVGATLRQTGERVIFLTLTPLRLAHPKPGYRDQLHCAASGERWGQLSRAASKGWWGSFAQPLDIHVNLGGCPYQGHLEPWKSTPTFAAEHP